MDELKPCPFCGQQHEWEETIDFHWGRHQIINCCGRVLMDAYNEKELESCTARIVSGQPTPPRWRSAAALRRG